MDGIKVLIVEDQALLALDLEMVVGDAGCLIVGAAMDQPGAMAIAASDPPDIALVDINLLDGQTGPLIARHLVDTYGTAVVFLTANLEQIPEGFAGALGAVSKPFDEQTIRSVLSFAARYIENHSVTEPPRRFRPAPWLTTPPENPPEG